MKMCSWWLCTAVKQVFFTRAFLKRVLLQRSSLPFLLLFLMGVTWEVYSMEESIACYSAETTGEQCCQSLEYSEKDLKSLFEETKNAVLGNKGPIENTAQILSLACVFPSFDESRELFKCVAAYEPLSLLLPPCKGITSVFHFIVAMVDYFAQKDSQYYEHFLADGGLALISWLASQGVEDLVLSEGKTAAGKSC